MPERLARVYCAALAAHLATANNRAQIDALQGGRGASASGASAKADCRARIFTRPHLAANARRGGGAALRNAEGERRAKAAA